MDFLVLGRKINFLLRRDMGLVSLGVKKSCSHESQNNLVANCSAKTQVFLPKTSSLIGKNALFTRKPAHRKKLILSAGDRV